MAFSYDNSDSGYVVSQADMDAAANRPGVGTILGPNTRYRPSNPNLPANVGQPWIDTQTGQTINGQLATDGKTIITGFSGGNSQNTTGYDVNTGQKTEADPHPWLDAAKNTALIWGGPELAGAGMALAAGGGAASGAGGGAAATGIAPSAAVSTAGTTGALTVPHVITPMVVGAATNAAKTKLGGGTWGQTLESAGVGAGTGALGGMMGGGLGGTLGRTALGYGSGALINAISNQGGPGSNTGIGPSQAGMAKGFQLGTANNPDIASALASGQQAGIANQPFRAGYTVNYPGTPAVGSYPGSPATSYNMPAINQPLLPWGPTATQGIGPSQLPPQIAQPRIPSRG